MTHLSCSQTREAKGTPLAGTRFGCSQLDKCCCHFSLGRKTDSSTEETKPLFDIIMVLKEFCPLANLAGNWTISVISTDLALERQGTSLPGKLVHSRFLRFPLAGEGVSQALRGLREDLTSVSHGFPPPRTVPGLLLFLLDVLSLYSVVTTPTVFLDF